MIYYHYTPVFKETFFFKKMHPAEENWKAADIPYINLKHNVTLLRTAMQKNKLTCKYVCKIQRCVQNPAKHLRWSFLQK